MPDRLSDYVVASQAMDTKSPETEFLNIVSSEILSDLFYNPSRGIRYLGISSILYPIHYSNIKQRHRDKIPAPSIHKTQFIINYSDESSLEINFRFLKPKLRSLQQNTTGVFRNTDAQTVTHSGKRFQSGVEDAEEFFIDKAIKLDEILKKEFTKKFNKDEDRETVKINENARYVYTVPGYDIELSIKCNKITETKALVTVKVANISELKQSSSISREFSPVDLFRKSLYGACTTIKCVSCKPEDPLTEESFEMCSNVNTFPCLSSLSPNTIFSSPVIIHDYVKVKPVPYSSDFKDVVENTTTLLDALDLLTDDQKNKLRENGNLEKTLSVFRALQKSTERNISRLHKFQWDGIQKFLQNILSDDPSPLIIRAPTGSGKSLIFYTCAVLLNMLRPEVTGTSTFITFPTRALNAQQFSEMTRFFYFLNLEGITISLGMYMGAGGDSNVKPLYPPEVEEGTRLPQIEFCPNCEGHEIIAKKPEDYRIIPSCTKCNKEFHFVYLSSIETQNYCPSVVVGTPDKIVYSMTHDYRSHSLFGAPCMKCPKCSTIKPLSDKDQAYQKVACYNCSFEMTKQNQFRSVPSFVIFDEVHTLSGTQGNLLSHFLSLLGSLSNKYGNKNSLWYLGASATVANQKELIHNLTGRPEDSLLEFPSQKTYIVTNGNGYFSKTGDLGHRYLVSEPVNFSARGSVTQVINNLAHVLQNVKRTNTQLIYDLRQKGIDANYNYSTQMVYVLRKSDGKVLEWYIPQQADFFGYPVPSIKFGSGDMSSSQLSALAKSVKDKEVDVLVVTQIYGQGMDFQGLNIIHFFGTPRKFIELHQAVGRTGRGNAPGLVVLHISPDVPRDEWVYRNFRYMINDIENLYEPTPINFANKYAISLSMPNVIHAMMLSKSYEHYQNKFANKAFEKLSTDDEFVESVYEDSSKIYLRDETRNDFDEIKQTTFQKLQMVADKLRGHINKKTRDVLDELLVPSLYKRQSNVPYFSDTQSAAVDKSLRDD